MRNALGGFLLASLGACGPSHGELNVTVAPDNPVLADDGTATVVRVHALYADDTISSGTVTLSSTAGTLEDTTLTLDKYASARTTFRCDAATDPGCKGTVHVTAKVGSVSATASISVGQAGPGAALLAPDCTKVSGDRPPSTGSLDAPKVSSASVPPVTPGQPLGGSVTFADPQNDESSVIVQLSSERWHFVCPLSAAELASKQFALSRLALTADFPPGTRLLYVGVKDAAAHVSGYSAVTLVIGAGGAISLCPTATSPMTVQLAGSAPSASTAFYDAANGRLGTYALGSANGDKMVIVYRASAQIDLGACTKLVVSGNAAGTAKPGWDNCLLAEARDASSGAMLSKWAYCSLDTPAIVEVATGATVNRPLQPDVPGSQLSPAVPSADPFGYQPGAIDLMSQIPSGTKSFVLSLYVLDFGIVGSTTEVWVRPQ